MKDWNDLERPDNVPEGAKYDLIEQTWEYGKGKNGYKIGEWKSWDDDGNLVKIDVWSEDKELLSRKYIQQENKAETKPDVSEDDNNTEEIINKLKELVVLDKKETAEQAVERYAKVNRFLLASYDEYYYEGEGYPEFFQKVSAEALQDEEKRLNITLPKTYKDFVLKHGLMRYDETAREMIFPLKTLSEALKDEWGMDDESIDEAYEGVTHPDDLIIFSYGDEGLQSEYYHCFEADGTVYDFNQDDLGYERQSHTDFDAYLQWATNTFIIEFLETEFDYQDFENWNNFY